MASDDSVIRPLTYDDDLDAFGRIVLASYAALPGAPHEPEYELELVDVRARVGAATVFGAFDGDTPLGCVTFVRDLTSPYAEDLEPGESSFRMLAVDAAAQGRGLGERLVVRCIDEARAAGSDAVFIHSAPGCRRPTASTAGSGSHVNPTGTGRSTTRRSRSSASASIWCDAV